MKPFAPYVRELEDLVTIANDPTQIFPNDRIKAALDGGPSIALRRFIPPELLRASGVFFTGSDLAERLISSIESDLENGAMVTDLACGSGNLLTRCAYSLPMRKGLAETLELWGRYLSGTDIHEEFVRTTKARLTLVALHRGAVPNRTIALEDTFPQIKLGNAFAPQTLTIGADCIVLNPPFVMTSAPSYCVWAQGKISTAALMLETCLRKAKRGAKVVAVLPEVLRTGSHYFRWRRMIEQLAKIESVEVAGLFDSQTDVDVFILRLTVQPPNRISSREWWKSSRRIEVTDLHFSDFFEISVGPVVPHRDPNLGHWYPFIHARDLPVWRSVNADRGFVCRRFRGRTHKPPFVAIRRTSRPTDKHRAVATIIRGSRPVAVENHLLVLQPKDGSLSLCLKSMEKLRSIKTNVWLNERIRCRHLTVSSIQEIPW